MMSLPGRPVLADRHREQRRGGWPSNRGHRSAEDGSAARRLAPPRASSRLPPTGAQRRRGRRSGLRDRRSGRSGPASASPGPTTLDRGADGVSVSSRAQRRVITLPLLRRPDPAHYHSSARAVSASIAPLPAPPPPAPRRAPGWPGSKALPPGPPPGGEVLPANEACEHSIGDLRRGAQSSAGRRTGPFGSDGPSWGRERRRRGVAAVEPTIAQRRLERPSQRVRPAECVRARL
jgi:hypothetical protein